jgi:hypothetical protein
MRACCQNVSVGSWHPPPCLGTAWGGHASLAREARARKKGVAGVAVAVAVVRERRTSALVNKKECADDDEYSPVAAAAAASGSNCD